MGWGRGGGTLRIRASKTLQFQQRSLTIPLPGIPGSPLCPVAALQSHLRFSSVRAHSPLFSVISPKSQRLFPITYRHFVLSTTTSAIGLVPAHYSPHSFRRGGASFAFKCNVPAQLIHRQGDWQSDAHLTYLNMFLEQKQLAVTSMADYILRLSSV